MLFRTGEEIAGRGLARYDKAAGVISLGDDHQNSSTIDPETGVIGRYGGYQIPVTRRILSPAEIIQWFSHLSEKAWFTPEMMAAFWAVLYRALLENGFNPHQLPDKMDWPVWPSVNGAS